MTDEDLQSLKDWIVTDPVSKEAWERKIVSVDDGTPIITARIAHLIYMIREINPVHIGNLIKKGRSR